MSSASDGNINKSRDLFWRARRLAKRLYQGVTVEDFDAFGLQGNAPRLIV